MMRDALGRVFKVGQTAIISKDILPGMVLAQVKEINESIISPGPQPQPRTLVFALSNFTVGMSGPGDVCNVAIIVQEADESIPKIEGKAMLTN